ncbi:hypothetical protein AB6A40_006710 [Gnathostoma spinigerum]|uniref:J domain-containing protein n=1 Tax=Gnathostoma spinigerum TaxID=75299 RepID=A0ABD6EJR9_9BILA
MNGLQWSHFGGGMNTFGSSFRRLIFIPFRSLSKDYYEVLGVPHTASQTEIKDAYYAKSKQFHPDANNNLTEREKVLNKEAFVELKTAYDVLRRPADRKAYDEKVAFERNFREYHEHFRDLNGTGAFSNRARRNRSWTAASQFIHKREQELWQSILRWTIVGLCVVIIYNVGYLVLVINRDRQLKSLVPEDEIARSFLRQKEYADKRDDEKHIKNFGEILRASIDRAEKERRLTFGSKNPDEIREEYRWFNVLHKNDASKQYRSSSDHKTEATDRYRSAKTTPSGKENAFAVVNHVTKSGSNGLLYNY